MNLAIGRIPLRRAPYGATIFVRGAPTRAQPLGGFGGVPHEATILVMGVPKWPQGMDRIFQRGHGRIMESYDSSMTR